MATAETGAIEHEDTARLYLAVGRLTRSLRRIGSGGSELGHGAVSALFTLVNQGSMRLGDLATKEGVAPPTLSRIVAALVEGGFVRREPDPNDGRASLVMTRMASVAQVMAARNGTSMGAKNRFP